MDTNAEHGYFFDQGTFLPKDQIVNSLELLWGNLYRMENIKTTPSEEKESSPLNNQYFINESFRLSSTEIFCENCVHQFGHYPSFQEYFYDRGKEAPWNSLY